jgi:DNA-binding CsgD family transcriptional regulator
MGRTADGRRSVIDVVEAAYDLADDDATWLARILDAVGWSRVGAHVAAALRLRRAARSLRDGDAVGARDTLRRAVVRIDRARGALRRRDPTAALEAWSALVDGRWSLVDRFESDGKRYVVALPNAPAAPDPRALSGMERAVAQYVAMGHANKLIAYKLGVAEGTVSAVVASVKRKLRFRSRAELITAVTTRERIEHDEMIVAGETIHVLARKTGRLARSDAWRTLTAAEREVAKLAIRGTSSDAIASKRACSRRTVDNLLARVFRKLGVSSRAELASLASERARK